jgi:predicted dehydrogenase
MKVLFCGLGSIGQRHLRNLRALLGDQVEVLAYRARGTSPVLNPNMTVRAAPDQLETTYNIRAFSSLDAALAEQPAAVFVTNPNTRHLPVALAAARAGCHLFIEKPVSHSLDGVDELARLVREKRLVAFVAYQFRFHPGLKLIKRMVDEGRFGNLVNAHIVNAEYLPDWHPYEDYRQTHPARRDLGGGSLRIQTHEMDYALWLFGMPTRVFAVGGHVTHLDVDVEDSVSVLMQCQPQGKPLPVHIHLDYAQRPPQRVCEIAGDAGKVRYDYYTNEIVFHDHATGISETHNLARFERNVMFLDEMRHFLDCVEGKAAPLIDLQEGINSLKISLAADESLRTQQSVSLI